VPRKPSPPERVAKAARLGRLLRRLREDAGWSREHLARRADISTETLRKIESGATTSPELFTVVALAEQLDTSLDVMVRSLDEDA
jgi:transcriptional regulator with XRE-family HTH domain